MTQLLYLSSLLTLSSAPRVGLRNRVTYGLEGLVRIKCDCEPGTLVGAVGEEPQGDRGARQLARVGRVVAELLVSDREKVDATSSGVFFKLRK